MRRLFAASLLAGALLASDTSAQTLDSLLVRGNIDSAQDSLFAFRDSEGARIFYDHVDETGIVLLENAKDRIKRFIGDGGTIDYVWTLANAGFTAREIITAFHAGKTAGEMINPLDTEDLDVLLLVADFDNNGFLTSTWTSSFFQQLNNYFDLEIMSLGSEDDIYNINCNYDAIVVAAHSTRNYARLSGDFVATNSLDKHDEQLKYLVDCLNLGGLLVYYGCEVRKRGSDTEELDLLTATSRLRKEIRVMGSNRKVYGATVVNINPVDVELFNLDGSVITSVFTGGFPGN